MNTRFAVIPSPELRARLDAYVERLQKEADEKREGPGRMMVSRNSVVIEAIEEYLKGREVTTP